MAAAIAHTHFVAHTYHMDIKPGNFLLDADYSLVLIDWEQSDAPITTAAPEIDSTWDVEEIPTEGLTTTLRYTKYQDTVPTRDIEYGAVQISAPPYATLALSYMQCNPKLGDSLQNDYSSLRSIPT
jgi:serine/threonine protein kinase